MPAEPPRND